MGRPAIKYTARLRALHDAKPRVMALPRGELLTSEPMAQILGVRWPTLREWCRDIPGFAGSNAFQGGANGIAYEFCPVRTLWFLIDHFTALGEAEQAKADRLSEMALGASAGAVRGLDLDDMNKILGTQDRFMTMREKAKQLVDATRVRTMLEKVFSDMQEVALTAPQELDPTGQWPPQVRALVDRATQGILLKQRAAARDALEGLKQG